MRKFAHMGKINPLSDRDQILLVGRYPGRNQVCNFWWWSVKGFRRGRGSNFPFPHPLGQLTCVVALTTLSHYRVSVWLRKNLFNQLLIFCGMVAHGLPKKPLDFGIMSCYKANLKA